LIFQLEGGVEKINDMQNVNYFVKTKEINEVKELKEKMIFLIKEYNPNRIIIEYNGTSDLKELLDMLSEKIYRECCKITTIFFVADGKSLNEYIDNIGRLIIPFIQSANMIIINNIECCSPKILEEGIKKIRSINAKAYILKVNNKYILKSTLRESKVLDKGYFKKIKIRFANYKSHENK
jgi:G3E family GTPase